VRSKPLALSTAAALLCAAGWWWLVSPGAPFGARGAGAPESLAAASGQSLTMSAAAPLTVHTTEAQASTTGDAFLSPDLRQTFEAMLFEATGGADMRDLAVLKKRLLALIPRYFPAQYIARAIALMERYVDYRVALGGLKPPIDPGDPRALRAALDARQQAREQHFTSQEYEVLFAQEARLDRYTVARIEIERNSALTTPQKQAALKDAERGLSDAQRAERDAATAHINVASQTAGFEAQGTPANERYAQRRAQYGDVAATQLGQLDREESDWQARLNDYAGAQARKASPEQLQLLRQQLFSQQEQLRVEAALAARP
jgi:lipase chaperone LimK